jgi:two-component system sensor histidine kinase QseC
MLELALRNLVDNALRHTPTGTQVEVRVGPGEDGAVVLSVSDDGARQGPQSSARPGMGVGLTLVQRIADAHGIRLLQGPVAPPFTTRYALVWPANPAQC